MGNGFAADWYWLMVVMETAALIVGAWIPVRAAVGRSFCESCGDWTNEFTVRKTPGEFAEALREKVLAEDWRGAASLPRASERVWIDYGEAVVTCCPGCAQTTVLLTERRSGVSQITLHARLSPEASHRLMQSRGAP